MLDRLDEQAAYARQLLAESDKQVQETIRQLDLDAEHEGMLRQVLERYHRQPDRDAGQLEREMLEVVMHQGEVKAAARQEADAQSGQPTTRRRR
jgi:hypothetical protein